MVAMGSNILYSKEYQIGYLPIYKNASVTYRTFLHQNGWEYINLKDLYGIKIKTLFSHIQNPETRLIKGITQLVYSKNARGILTSNMAFFILRTYHDPHVLSVSDLIKPFDNYIHLIPLDLKYKSSNELTNQFFEEHNINLRIELNNIKNQSNKIENEIKKLVIQGYGLDKDREGNDLFKQVMKVYEEDKRLYQEAIRYYTTVKNPVVIQEVIIPPIIKTRRQTFIDLLIKLFESNSYRLSRTRHHL